MTSFDIHRGGRPPATPCPSDLELALFVEGTLPPDSRDRMVMHLAECDDCREVVATVVAAQAVDDLSAPAAASVWTELAQAVGPARTLEARLSGLPAHVPLRPPTRTAGTEAGFAAAALAARLAERAALPTADAAARRAARHAAAVAALMAGRAEDAVTRLDAALADTSAAAPERADLLADLAAAHGALADATTREHWTAALAAADLALTIDGAHEAARFNRALALERLGRREAALAAWRDIAEDAATAAGWRDEAAHHAHQRVP